MLRTLKITPLLSATMRPTGKGKKIAARGGVCQDANSRAARTRDSYVEENHRSQAILDFVGDAVLATDIDAKVTYMNRAAEALTGFTRCEALGMPVKDIFQVIDVATRLTRPNIARHVMESGVEVALLNSALLKTKDGRQLAIEEAAIPLHSTRGQVVGALIKFHDSRYSDEKTARMAYLAQHDSLTGLLNRSAFAECFQQAAALARRHQKKMVMLFIDLDNFKEVNDTLGHASGDALLQALGKTLLDCVRTTDHVCRHGGDEFVVLLSDLTHHDQAFAVVDKVRQAAGELLRLSSGETTLELSIGISLFPNDGETLEALLPHADAAMYRVKRAHKLSDEQTQ